MKKKLQTSFDLLLEIIRLEKDECTLEFKRIKSEEEKNNDRIKTVKEKIVYCEELLRNGKTDVGASLDLSNYELLRNNLTGLNDLLQDYLNTEAEIKVELQKAVDVLTQKIRSYQVLTEKQVQKIHEMLDLFAKKEQLELDDLCSQRKWVEEYV